MNDDGYIIFFKFVLTSVLWAAIYWGVQGFGHWIAWWAALAISLVIVWGGFLLLDGDSNWFD